VKSVQARVPQWNEPRAILKVLRAYNYDVSETVAWAKLAHVVSHPTGRSVFFLVHIL
jgi:hypothetical protein